MNVLLVFFAIPVATIILAVVLQKILQSPLLVAATAFAIFLIVTFTAFDESFLVFAIVYTLLALITALIVRFICCLIKNSNNPCINGKAIRNNGICGNSNNANDENNDDDNNTNNSGCGCNRSVTNSYYTRRYMMRR
ncbi:MAG: DUF2651 family protein [Clostridia bacterium]|nr:DUF2651 family protein [Clostridia bacterium]